VLEHVPDGEARGSYGGELDATPVTLR
jgi:hypothetical protein